MQHFQECLTAAALQWPGDEDAKRLNVRIKERVSVLDASEHMRVLETSVKACFDANNDWQLDAAKDLPETCANVPLDTTISSTAAKPSILVELGNQCWSDTKAGKVEVALAARIFKFVSQHSVSDDAIVFKSYYEGVLAMNTYQVAERAYVAARADAKNVIAVDPEYALAKQLFAAMLAFGGCVDGMVVPAAGAVDPHFVAKRQEFNTFVDAIKGACLQDSNAKLTLEVVGIASPSTYPKGFGRGVDHRPIPV